MPETIEGWTSTRMRSVPLGLGFTEKQCASGMTGEITLRASAAVVVCESSGSHRAGMKKIIFDAI
jgi:hypothetical protein